MKGGLGSRAVERCKRFGKRLSANSVGFTVVEVMIVLSVTGVLLVSAIFFISGRQARTEFNQAIQQTQADIQQIIGEVSTGFYASQNNFRCTPSASGPTLTAGSGQQGTNGGCIFVGKAMQFAVAGTSPQEEAIFAIAGLQQTPASTEVTSLAEARPKVVAPTPSNSAIPNITDRKLLQNGLKVVSMSYDNGAAGSGDIGAVAFVSSMAQYNGSEILSGSQQVNVVPILTSVLDATQAVTADAINTNLATGPINPTNGVKLCFQSGTTNQSGEIIIGTNGRQLSVTLKIKGNPTCA